MDSFFFTAGNIRGLGFLIAGIMFILLSARVLKKWYYLRKISSLLIIGIGILSLAIGMITFSIFFLLFGGISYEDATIVAFVGVLSIGFILSGFLDASNLKKVAIVIIIVVVGTFIWVLVMAVMQLLPLLKGVSLNLNRILSLLLISCMIYLLVITRDVKLVPFLFYVILSSISFTLLGRGLVDICEILIAIGAIITYILYRKFE